MLIYIVKSEDPDQNAPYGQNFFATRKSYVV